MAKKIKFPLILKDGANVRSLEELQKNFDMGKVLEYYHNGKLLTWLEDRGLRNQYRQLSDISPSKEGYLQQICTIFDVAYDETYKGLFQKEKDERQRKRQNWLKEYTDKETLLQKAEYLIYCDRERIIYFDWENRTVKLCRISDEEEFVLLDHVYSTAYFISESQSIGFLVVNDMELSVMIVNIVTGEKKKCDLSSGETIPYPLYNEYFSRKDGKRFLKFQSENYLMAEYHSVEIM